LPLETATYISDLVTSNPAASDGMNNADDHMRLIKAAVKATFPNISGQVTATHTDLNNAAGFLAGTVVSKVPLGAIAAPSYTFIGDLDTGFWSPGANQISGSVGGVRWFTVAADKSVTYDGNVSVTGTLTSTGALSGPGIVPIGGMIMWLSDTLPTVGTWCWANGGTLSRTTYATFFGIVGTTYGAGDGSTTFNVINMQEVVPVGKSTMGGAASPGLLASISGALKAALNGIFGTDTNTIAVTNLPPYTPAGTITNGAIALAGDELGRKVAGDSNNNGGGGGSFSAMTGTALDITASQAPSTFTGTAQGGASTPMGNAQPSRAVNFIIRVA
jgi:microcystin-dependent protein